jgi:NADP-dependent 3-hydroxy acid dehydrogenase YdfG
MWREMFDVNLFAIVELTRLLLPALRAAAGHVVLINWTVNASSAAGQRPTRPQNLRCARLATRCAPKNRCTECG